MRLLFRSQLNTFSVIFLYKKGIIDKVFNILGKILVFDIFTVTLLISAFVERGREMENTASVFVER